MRSETEIRADAAAVYAFLAACPPPPARADLILALGSHDLRVPEFAAALYHRGAAPLVVCAGGLGKITEELWTRSEGEQFAARCEALGVTGDVQIVGNGSRFEVWNAERFAAEQESFEDDLEALMFGA